MLVDIELGPDSPMIVNKRPDGSMTVSVPRTAFDRASLILGRQPDALRRFDDKFWFDPSVTTN